MSNPVGFLQEYVQKHNTAPFPTYVESGESGPPHAKLFTCQCIYDGFEASGSGSTKKQAKTNASKEMIQLLKHHGFFEENNHKVGACFNLETSNSNLNIKNPISILQEYCQQNKILLPNYIENNKLGLFSCECHVGDKKTVGGGTCKKSSKTEAAHKMCKILNLIKTATEDSNIEISKDKEENFASKYKMLRAPLPVIDITNTLQKTKLADEPKAETMSLNYSLVEIEPNTLKAESHNGEIKVEAAVQQNKTYISLLQEYCQKNKIDTPKYSEGGNVGDTFVCECILNDRTTFGEGLCKKSSKNEAARKMCEILKLVSFTTGSPNIGINEEAEDSFASEYQRLRSSLPESDGTCMLEEFRLTEDESEGEDS